MKSTITLLALALTITVNAQNKLPFQLEKDWETTGFENPESVVLDETNSTLYVSNVNEAPTDKDGNGYISKVSLEGKITTQKWITVFDAPKGLVIFKNKLYVTDIDKIVEIDIPTGRIVKSYKADGATFLNDITVDEKGTVFASNTFGFSGIYKLPATGNRKVELWLKDEKLNMPNGLTISKNKLMTAGWGVDLNSETFATKVPGKLLSIDLKTKAIETITPPIGNLDGLSQNIHGYLLSDWFAGKLLYYANKSKTTTKVIDLPKGSADTYFDKNTKSVFIPLMLDNKLLKYHFKK